METHKDETQPHQRSVSTWKEVIRLSVFQKQWQSSLEGDDVIPSCRSVLSLSHQALVPTTPRLGYYE